jgi:hypothetical protein
MSSHNTFWAYLFKPYSHSRIHDLQAQQERGDITELVEPIASGVDGNVALQPGGGAKSESEAQRLKPHRFQRYAASTLPGLDGEPGG